MPLVEIVTLLALIQYLYFAALVGRARGKYGVHAPAVTGHEMFERFHRVQMNTLEVMVVFLPALWLAARYWPPLAVGAIGAVYLVGRMVYLRAYVRDPASRHIGFGLTMFPIALLVLAGIIGLGISLFEGWQR